MLVKQALEGEITPQDIRKIVVSDLSENEKVWCLHDMRRKVIERNADQRADGASSVLVKQIDESIDMILTVNAIGPAADQASRH